MGFKCGILGLSNVGKSTLFNALTATAAAQASNYPFSTIEPNVGEVMVPDPRLDVLAELDSLERRVDILGKKAKGNDKEAVEARETLDLVNRAFALLRDGKPARLVERKPEEEKVFRMLGLLTAIPVLYVCNVDEGAAATGNEFSRRVEARAREEGAACVVISAKIEAEIAVLPAHERAEYLAAIGLKEPGLDRLIRAGYGLLNLVTYFTAGPKEAAAWTITRGTKAPRAAA